jgi:hypothetical protein
MKMTIQEILNSFNAQSQYILNELSKGEFDNAVKDTKLLSDWLGIRLNELNEKDGESN